MKKSFLIGVIILLVLVMVMAYALFFAGVAPAKNISWGVDFSQMRAESLRLDWKEVYLAILTDLKAKDIKLHTQWDFVEGQQGDFYFHDIDWQLQEAKNHGAEIIYVLGMKTGRWPECHIPTWANTLSQKEQQAAILNYIAKVVERYKDNEAIAAWQAENEPLFKFGQCPWYDTQFLKQEVALIKSLDSTRPVIISDSGEQSLWWWAASIGDMVGTTLYRISWIHISNTLGFYLRFPVSPFTYWARAQVVEHIFHKKVINVELQAEPWTPDVSYGVSADEQEKTMNPEQFRRNVEYAKRTGFDAFYFWGAEWWYWQKETQGKPEIWDMAKEIINQNQ